MLYRRDIMSLDVGLYLEVDVGNDELEYVSFYNANITHNLGNMADKADIYYALWRPEEINCKYAEDIINLLESGLKDLKARPKYFEQFNSPNGWGMYEHFVPFVEKYLDACKKYPKAMISISR
tara:strand:- start:648 stop:1016 length:369 start_codon:yes stop_codon:yes gene_type:complete